MHCRELVASWCFAPVTCDFQQHFHTHSIYLHHNSAPSFNRLHPTCRQVSTCQSCHLHLPCRTVYTKGMQAASRPNMQADNRSAEVQGTG